MEMLVSFSLFAILASVAVSVLLTVFRSHGYVFSTLNSQANLRFVLETMTREIKEGSDLDFDLGTKTLSFVNKDGVAIDYFLEENKIKRREDADVMPITAEDLVIETFSVGGCWQDIACQPRVTIFLKVRPLSAAVQDAFFLQTTIVQRKIGI